MLNDDVKGAALPDPGRLLWVLRAAEQAQLIDAPCMVSAVRACKGPRHIEQTYVATPAGGSSTSSCASYCIPHRKQALQRGRPWLPGTRAWPVYLPAGMLLLPISPFTHERRAACRVEGAATRTEDGASPRGHVGVIFLRHAIAHEAVPALDTQAHRYRHTGTGSGIGTRKAKLAAVRCCKASRRSSISEGGQ